MPIRSTRVAAITTGTTRISDIRIGTPKAVMLLLLLRLQIIPHRRCYAVGRFLVDGHLGRVCIWAFIANMGASSSDVHVFGAKFSACQDNKSGRWTTDGPVNSASWITDGIRLTWNDLPSTAVLLTVTFWYGDDIA